MPHGKILLISSRWNIWLFALLLGTAGAHAQSNLWTGNFTNANWFTNWFTEGAPVASRGLIFGSHNHVRTTDASAPGGGYLRVTYPATSYAPSAPPPIPVGGMQFYGAVLHTNGNTPREALTLQYSVRFPTNFNFVNGGKLPGLYAGIGNTGSNFPDGTNGFTTRFMWRTNGGGEAFPFLPDSAPSLGTSLGRGNWIFAGDNQWHTLRQDVMLNDAGAANGWIRVWYDGVAVLEWPGLVFRKDPALKLDGILFQTFFGGGDPSYATPVTTYADFAAFSVSDLVETNRPLPWANYQATVTSQQPVSYFKFDESLTNAVGSNISLIVNGSGGGGGPARDYFGNPSKARFFSAANDALITSADPISGGGTGPNLNATGKGSISFLFRTLDSTNSSSSQAFVISQGNVATNGNAFGLFFENATAANGEASSLKLRIGDKTTALLLADKLPPARWHFFAVTYDEARDANEVKWYVGALGGTLKPGVVNISNHAVIGDDGSLYLGNNAGLNNAFRNPGGVGWMDEFAVWNRELTTREITNQFNAALPRPRVNIELFRDSFSTNVVLSWSTSMTAGLVLKSAPDLSPTGSWSSVASPMVLGEQYVVTNSAAPGRRFYRLSEP